MDEEKDTFEVFAAKDENFTNSDFSVVEDNVYITDGAKAILKKAGRKISRRACLEHDDIEMWVAQAAD